jgi:hypothetical protein
MTGKRDEKAPTGARKGDATGVGETRLARFEEQLADAISDGDDRIVRLEEQLAEAKANVAAVVSVLQVAGEAATVRDAIEGRNQMAFFEDEVRCPVLVDDRHSVGSGVGVVVDAQVAAQPDEREGQGLADGLAEGGWTHARSVPHDLESTA